MWSLRFPFFWSCVCHYILFTAQRMRPWTLVASRHCSDINMYVEEFVFCSERTKIDSLWYEKKCGSCGRVEDLSDFFTQGCAPAEPGGPWRPTFALVQLENERSFIQIICWAPWILQVQSTGLPSIFNRARPCLRFYYTFKMIRNDDWDS